ncbi:hypothetical protein [Nocardia speluncae]|uniref:hypothetical protein n=1 Tax=Nocardia speluncae TaxID=419477 RepID=UPI000AD0333C|nr:hypothetical protein [Nocardia speluncae]
MTVAELAQPGRLHRRRFVSRYEFAAMTRTPSDIDLAAFRADQDATVEACADDPYC